MPIAWITRERRQAAAELKNFARLGRRYAAHYAPLSRSVKGKLILRTALDRPKKAVEPNNWDVLNRPAHGEDLDRKRITQSALAAPKCGVAFVVGSRTVEDLGRATAKPEIIHNGKAKLGEQSGLLTKSGLLMKPGDSAF